MKDLKQKSKTFTRMKGMIIVEQDDKESWTAAGVDKRPAEDIGYKSTEMA